ncbi:hypothetical protein Tco_0820293 [Tanacetum coccineum]|uniref:Retrovirus-related Pol polyprotein from transposon TNT 1-94-like beta-barrel domain-containing protein n=1 Tax=Tanacetum coccineum TaxID=301880 RepID=A0ABQ5ADQ6_9ASTR
MESQSESTQTVYVLKLPMLNIGNYDLWSMRMEQYLTHTNHALWEVIVNGDAPAIIVSTSASAEGPIPPKTAKQILARKNELKAKSTMLLAIPDEHLLKVSMGNKDGTDLMGNNHDQFGGNKESNKMFQKHHHQLEIHGEVISQEDANLKLLRSLPPAWNTHTLIMRNKSDLDTLSMDDLYNNLKVYEAKIKCQSSSSSNSQNVAFGQCASTYAVMSYQRLNVTTAIGEVTLLESSHQGIKGIEIEIIQEGLYPWDTLQMPWSLLMDGLFIVAKSTEEGPTDVCYYYAYSSLGSSSSSSSDTENEAVFEEDIAFLKYDVKVRDNSITELKNQLEEALKEKDDLKLKLEKFETSSKNLTKLINSQISVNNKTGVGFDSQMNENELNNIHMNKSKVFESAYDSSVNESEKDNNQVNDRYKAGEGYHAVPPPYTGNFMPPRHDLSFAGLDDSLGEYEKPKSVRSSAPIIEDWEADSDDDYRQAKNLRKSQRSRVDKRNWNEMMTRKLGWIVGKATGQREVRPVWNNAHRVNHQNFSNNLTHPHPRRNFVPSAVMTNSGKVPVNTAKQSFLRAAISTSTTRYVNIAASRPTVNVAKPSSNVFHKSHSPVKRTSYQRTSPKNSDLKEKVNTVKVNNVTTAGTKAVVSAVQGHKAHAGNPQHALKDQGIVDSGCSRHMTGNKAYISDYQEIDGGFIAFGGSPKGGKITGKGNIRTEKLDFDDVYFVKELKFNLFSVSQMCDKKNSVLFTETECVILSLDFKLLDENQVLLKVPGQNNIVEFVKTP